MLLAQAIEDLEEVVAALKGSHRFPVTLISHGFDYSLLLTSCHLAHGSEVP